MLLNAIPDLCVFCGKFEETVDGLFLHYKLSYFLWSYFWLNVVFYGTFGVFFRFG